MDENSSTKPSLTERWKALRTRNKVIIIVVALVILGVIFSPADDGDSGSDKAEASTSKTEPDKKADKTKAEKPKTPKQKMTDGIKKAGTNVKVSVKGKQVDIKSDYPEGLTDGNARGNSQREVTDMLQATVDSGWLKKHKGAVIVIDQSAALVDQYGKESKDEVVHLIYFDDEVSKINFDNFDPTNSWDLATESFIHPAVRE